MELSDFLHSCIWLVGGSEQSRLFIYFSQYHACWCADVEMSQAVSNKGIDLIDNNSQGSTSLR